MRVATLSNPKLLTNVIGRVQTDIARLQSQAATGKAFAAPSQDPFGATRSLQLTRALEQLEQFEANAGRAEDRLTQQEITLGDLGNVFQRVRDLAIQSNNGALSDENRRAIATEVEQLRLEALALGNATDGEGRYLFSGYRSETEPFADVDGGVQYLGDQGERQLRIGPTRSVSDGASGDAVFLRVPDGNGTFTTAPDASNQGTGIIDAGTAADATVVLDQRYTIEFTSTTDYEVRDGSGTVITSGTFVPGEPADITFDGIRVGITGQPEAGDSFDVAPSRAQDVFETLDRLISALRTPTDSDRERALFNNAVNSSLADIDQALENFSTQRARAGSRLNAVDSQRRLNADSELLLEASRATVENVDLVETISELELQLTSLEAAQRSFVAVQQLSLFNFL
jgi:flagellar hook-associated protein 3 FlgL